MGSFLLDARPVTNGDWEAFVQATDAKRPPWMYRPGVGEPEQPVVGVTLEEARRFARWAGKRLPTSREWLRAARAGDERRQPWGDDEEATAAHAHLVSRASGCSAEVVDAEARPRGRGPFGHRDLVGNVWEWCADGSARGGFWGLADAWVGSVLEHEAPDRRVAGIGFRCAL